MIAAGTKFGPYEIKSAIGAGGMGEVYSAQDARLARAVAVKILPAAFCEDGERLRRFQQEARAVAALNHPNIVAVYDVGEQDGISYLVAELLEGQTLRERLRAGGLGPRRAAEVGLQLAQGLAAAHGKGIVHRDLKPENIFITRENRVKILDFGLAKQVPSLAAAAAAEATIGSEVATTPGVVLGTVGYMAPEQVRGQAADARSDIFALGAILYEMLSGKRAFQRGTAAETMTAILKEDPPEMEVGSSAQAVTPAMERIVRRCLEKAPEARFQSASDLGFAIEGLSGTSTQARVMAAGRPALWRRPWLWSAAALALAAVLGVALIASRSNAPAAPSYKRLTFAQEIVPTSRFASGSSVFYTGERNPSDYRIYATSADDPQSRAVDMPQALLWSISSRNEMAVCLKGGELQAHNTCLGTLAVVPTAGGQPREIIDNVESADWSPDGAKLAISHIVGTEHRLEYPIGKVLYKTAGWITQVRVSPDGKQVAFLDHTVWPDDRGFVAVVGEDGKMRGLAGEFPSEEGLAWSAKGDEVWFSASPAGANSSLFAVSLDGKQRLLAAIPGDINLADVARDGSALVDRSQQFIGTHALLAGNAKEQDYSWLDWGLPSDISADGKLLLFSEDGDGGGPHYTTFLWRAGESSPVRLGEGHGSSLSPDGKTVISILHGNQSRMMLLPTGAGEAQELPQDGIEAYFQALWLLDGKQILFSGSDAQKRVFTYVMYLSDPTKLKQAAPEGIEIPFGSHVVSPDGKSFAAYNPSDASWKLYPLAGGAARPIAVRAGESIAGWAANGRDIFISSTDFANLYKMEAATGKRTLLRTLPEAPARTDAIVTPDGKYYAYGKVTSSSELYLMQGAR